ncbi:unnamed protein product [Moneuplotes crassus]|uniref:Uncharacterized protein n=1 Tax=Euplotes crassus TaxID=5936 RepID=A0AAD1XU47_EUPCR|nr:unnamed protein product [Moneuplotes crassus]
MHRKPRPTPLSPQKIINNLGNRRISLKHECKSPIPKITQSLFPKEVEDKQIQNMKIFDQNNNEGMPRHWDDKLKPYKGNPSIYDSINFTTLKPDLTNRLNLLDHNNKRTTMVYSSSSMRRSNDQSISKRSTDRLIPQPENKHRSMRTNRRRLKSYQNAMNKTGKKSANLDSPYMKVGVCRCKNRSREDSLSKEKEDAKAATMVLTKMIADEKKEVKKLSKKNQDLLNKISELEKQLSDVTECLRKQEQMWIKSIETTSPTQKVPNRSMKIDMNFSSKTKSNKAQIGEKPKVKINYRQNMKTMVHQKYLKKIEDLQKRHEKEMHLLRRSFAKQLEDMTELVAATSNETIKVRDDAVTKCRSLFDIVIDKDVLIEELEDQISKANQTTNDSESDGEIYQLKAKIQVLKTNLKIKEKENNETERMNSKLKAKVIQLKKKILKFTSPCRENTIRLKNIPTLPRKYSLLNRAQKGWTSELLALRMNLGLLLIISAAYLIALGL